MSLMIYYAKSMMYILELLRDRNKTRFTYRVDVDNDDNELAKKYGVQAAAINL